MPLLAYPLALLAAVGIPALVAIYFLRNRFRRQPVSSLMLWLAAARAREGGARVTRMTAPLAFFLELLALLFLVLAACDLRWPSAAGAWPLAIVLDDSISMTAGTGADTARHRGEEAVAKLVAAQRARFVRFILAGKEPRVLDAAPGRDAVPGAMREWRCESASACLERAAALACELGGPRSRVLVVTDHEPAPGSVAGERIRWLAAGVALPNAGIVNAARTEGPDKDRCFIEAAAFSPRPMRTELVVDDGRGRELLRRSLTLESGAPQRVVFDAPRAAAAIRATLSADPLAADNRVLLLAAPARTVRVLLRVEDPAPRELWSRALAATGMQAPPGEAPELVITDRGDVNVSRPETWLVRVLDGKDARAYTGPFVLNSAHPLVKGLSLDGTVWGAPGTNALPGVPVVEAGSIPLVTDETFASGRHVLRFRLSPAASTLQETPDWPILAWNLLQWRASESEGLAEPNVRLGGEALLRVAAGESAVRIIFPDGRSERATPSGRRLAIEPRQLGVYKALTDKAAYAFASNLLSPEESDLSACTSGEWGAWAGRETIRHDYASSAWIFGILALAAMTAHLAVVTRGAA